MRSVLSVVLSAATLATGIATANADDVTMNELPRAVRAAVEKESQGAVLEDIERERRGGEVYYVIEIERADTDWTVKIDDKGRVLDRSRD